MSTSSRIADALVLVFSEGVSLRMWAQSGILERELALYDRLVPHVGRILLATWGGADDPAVLDTCRTSGPVPRRPEVWRVVSLAPASGPLASRRSVGERVVEALGDARTVIVKSNQLSAGPAADHIVTVLRSEQRDAAMIARGGYAWSAFAARMHGGDSPLARQILACERHVCRRADLVVGTTGAMLDYLAAAHGLAREALALIPNYVLDPPRLGGPRDGDEVLFAGRLVPQKRVERLIEAVACLPSDLRARCRLTIVGDGPQREWLEAHARQARVTVRFVPRLPHRDLLALMSRCGVYMQVSDFEGHPKTVLEAMVCGAAVLVADTPGLGDVVEPGRTGLVAPPEASALAESLARLMRDGALRHRLGVAAAARARRDFSLSRIVSLELAALRAARYRAPRRTAHPAASCDGSPEEPRHARVRRL